MRLAGIVNKDELWLPTVILKHGVAHHLNIDEVIQPHGIVIPTRSFYHLYKLLEEKRLLNSVEDEEHYGSRSGIRLNIITGDVMWNIRGDTSSLHIDRMLLTKDYNVYEVDLNQLHVALAAKHLLKTGHLKSPKDLITRLRKNFHHNVSYEKYSVKELLRIREERYGEIKPIPYY